MKYMVVVHQIFEDDGDLVRELVEQELRDELFTVFPEPFITIEPFDPPTDWPYVPKEYKYQTVNSTGFAEWWKEKPVYVDGFWSSNNEESCVVWSGNKEEAYADGFYTYRFPGHLCIWERPRHE